MSTSTRNKATFWIKDEIYRSKKGFRQDVSVRLEVNYHDKTFSIYPGNGQEEFMFECSYGVDPDYWAMIVSLIKDAIELGKKELDK